MSNVCHLCLSASFFISTLHYLFFYLEQPRRALRTRDESHKAFQLLVGPLLNNQTASELVDLSWLNEPFCVQLNLLVSW